jgi:hypothetical protein
VVGCARTIGGRILLVHCEHSSRNYLNRYQDYRSYLGYANTPVSVAGKIIMYTSCKYWKGKTREWERANFNNSFFQNPTCGNSRRRQLATSDQLQNIYDRKFAPFQTIRTVLTAIDDTEAAVETAWKGSIGVAVTELADILKKIVKAVNKAGAAFHSTLGPVISFFSTIIDKVRRQLCNYNEPMNVFT